MIAERSRMFVEEPLDGPRMCHLELASWPRSGREVDSTSRAPTSNKKIVDIYQNPHRLDLKKKYTYLYIYLFEFNYKKD